MGNVTAIEWCDHTFNPWWGCTRVSPGCEHCYAETFSKRVGLKVWGTQVDRRFFGDKHWTEPLKWNAAAAKLGERRRVFCASMADVFEDRRDLDAQRARLFALIHETPALDWLLLTKRPENMQRLASARWIERWPANVWAGCTVEDQGRVETRIPHLLEVPAQVRFLSCEPLLGPVDIGLDNIARGPLIDWVIVGGESGPRARPCAIEWVEDIVRQCREFGPRPFVKQMGAVVVSEERTCSLDAMCSLTGKQPADFDGFLAPSGEVWAWRAGLTDKKGADVEQFPELLRIREFPEVSR